MNYEYEAELEGEFEGAYEEEFEGELEGAHAGFQEGEEFLGTLSRGLGSLLSARQGQFEDEYEGAAGGLMEDEYEDEYEDEEFFRRIARGIGGFVRRAAPILKNVARVAAPIVGSAVGGPLGGMIGKVAASALREDELGFALEGEIGGNLEYEYEDEFEATPLTAQQAQAELMAAVAARAQSPAEAEAMAGAATTAALSAADRQMLRGLLPHLVRGTAVLTRILRQNPATRPAIRTLPTIVQRTANTVARQAEVGRPVTLQTTARIMANQTRQVLSSPQTCAKAMQRNVRAARAAARSSQRPTARRAGSRQRPVAG